MVLILYYFVAPLVWLHSEDPFRPSDLGKHLEHTVPMIGDKPVEKPLRVDLDNLDQLNRFGGGKRVALTSKDDVTELPEWLYGEKPDADGKLQNATASVVIVVERSPEDVDAFYFYFYSFDQGGNTTQVKEPIRSLFNGTENGLNMGNHVGDWYVETDRRREHLLTRTYSGSIIWSVFMVASLLVSITVSIRTAQLTSGMTTMSRSRTTG